MMHGQENIKLCNVYSSDFRLSSRSGWDPPP